LAALGLGRQSSMLDFGCGPGRLAIGLQATLGRIENYVGVDVNKTAIRWCRRHLANPGFTFELLSSRNARYNPRGRAGIDRLPLDEETMDFAYLYSVFSHMGSQDVANVLESIHPVLRRDGAIFATAFVEDGVPHEEENPADYMMPWSGPLHCVRFERGHFEALARSAGFDVEQLTTHEETDGQSAFILRRTDRQAPSSC
jgi:SAM-dependent methyltransferase